MKKVSVILIQHYKGLNVGEIAGYPEDMADKMIKAGIAKLNSKKDKKEEKEKDVVKAPEAKMMRNVEDLMSGKIDDIKEELEAKTSDDNYLYPTKYLEDALDYESLNKGRESMMDHLIEEVEKRNAEG